MSNRYKYGEEIAESEDASGVEGILIRTDDGYALRVKDPAQPDGFIDCRLRHDDLSVQIGSDSLASIYRVNDDYILDHSPQVLGLEQAPDE